MSSGPQGLSHHLPPCHYLKAGCIHWMSQLVCKLKAGCTARIKQPGSKAGCSSGDLERIQFLKNSSQEPQYPISLKVVWVITHNTFGENLQMTQMKRVYDPSVQRDLDKCED